MEATFKPGDKVWVDGEGFATFVSYAKNGDFIVRAESDGTEVSAAPSQVFRVE